MSEPIYNTTVDKGAFKVVVTRLEPYRGELVVTQVDGNVELLREDVPVAFDAPFGPDVDDVTFWQQKALKAIDEAIAKAKEPQ